MASGTAAHHSTTEISPPPRPTITTPSSLPTPPVRTPHLGGLGRGRLALPEGLFEVCVHGIVGLPLSFRRLDPHAGHVLVALVTVVLSLEVVERLVLSVERELSQVLLAQLAEFLVQLLSLLVGKTGSGGLLEGGGAQRTADQRGQRGTTRGQGGGGQRGTTGGQRGQRGTAGGQTRGQRGQPEIRGVSRGQMEVREGVAGNQRGQIGQMEVREVSRRSEGSAEVR